MGMLRNVLGKNVGNVFLVYKRQDLAQKLHDQWPKCANMAELLHEKCLQGRKVKKNLGLPLGASSVDGTFSNILIILHRCCKAVTNC